jgi:hypothetical protein
LFKARKSHPHRSACSTIALVNEPDFALAEVEKLIGRTRHRLQLLRYLDTAYFVGSTRFKPSSRLENPGKKEIGGFSAGIGGRSSRETGRADPKSFIRALL